MSIIMTALLQTLLAIGLLTTPALAAATCYRMDGSELTDGSFAPCDPDAEVSSCCSTNKINGDLCMSSGLCYAQMGTSAGFIYSNGCTDKSGKAKECPHICPDKDDQGNAVEWWNVLQCTRGKYCCTSDDSSCCGDEKKIFQTDIGVINMPSQTTLTVTQTATNSAGVPVPTSSSGSNDNSTCDQEKQCPKDNTAVVGGALGGVLGTALLASLGLVAYLIRKRPSSSPNEKKISAQELEPAYRPVELQGNSAYTK